MLQDDLGPLIETARGLQIKGLADAGGSDKKKDQVHQQQQQQHVQPQQKEFFDWLARKCVLYFETVGPL